MSYADSVRAVLPPNLRRLFAKLGSPAKIQNYLDTLPINFEISGESNLSPIQVFEKKTAHCFEGAVFAAAALAYHGRKPLLMDFATAYDDEDHAVALFKEHGRWGAISKTNHAILKYRDAIYATPRELAMSYAHEYYLRDGRKSLRAYSAPFDVSKYPPKKWITAGESPKDSKLPTGQASQELDWLVARIAKGRYFPLAPEKNMRRLRKASKVELSALELIEWPDPRKPML